MTWRDPYLWPDLDVLKNKASIKSLAELAEYEANFCRLRTYLLAENPIQGVFDIQQLRNIHQYLFQDVYDFAGEIRTINISKEHTFANAPEIIRLSEYLFTQLQKENFLSKLSPFQFAERAALYFNAVNAIHPFREGNGRTQRIFMEQLAKEAGHALNIAAVSNKITMVEASKQGVSTDIDGVVGFDTQRPTLFIDMFQKAINPAYVDIMQQARVALAKDSEIPELIPFIDGNPMLTVEGIILARNDTYTAQMHGLSWFAIHQNTRLLDTLQSDELAIVQYDQQGMGVVKHAGKALEFPSPIHLSTFQLEQAKPIIRLDTAYHGKFVHMDDKHIYQELERDSLVKHQRSAFAQTQLPEVGKFGAIRYKNGQAQLVSKAQDKKLELSR